MAQKIKLTWMYCCGAGIIEFNLSSDAKKNWIQVFVRNCWQMGNGQVESFQPMEYAGYGHAPLVNSTTLRKQLTLY